MLKLSEQQIIEKILAEEAFECVLLDGAFSVKIDEYTPTICTAIHAGSRFRDDLKALCLLSDTERYFEEDPYTEQFIQAMPITLVAHDSRYEYDLNRPIARCVYQKAWGKEVWKQALPKKQREASIEKHQAFYRIVDALITKIEKKFGAVLIFDIHSYNYLRIGYDAPTFNIGTEQIDLDRWQPAVLQLESRLKKVTLPNLPVRVGVDEVFYGRGYMIAHVNSRFQNTLVLPLEIKKIFMNEENGELFPLIFQTLNTELKQCITNVSAFFARKYTRKKKVRSIDMLASKIDPAILSVDKQLFRLGKELETLHYINPINIPTEKKKFFASKEHYIPEFRYRPLDVDPYHFREQIYHLPVEKIRDPGVQQLYRQVIDALSFKIDLLVSAGQEDFLYNCLRYYGEPSLEDENNAAFLLHASEYEETEEKNIRADELANRFREKANEWEMTCKVEISQKLVAAAMVSGNKRTVYINKDILLSEIDARALLHHELGVHMATTLNANMQSLKVFTLGMPGNTMTQEGLAILNEFQSGNMPLGRLKTLALRVLAVKEMLKYGNFRHTYHFLKEEHNVSEDSAFSLAVRVHRGGGFTKDYLYLRGVSEALNLSSKQDISGLYVGKTGFDYLPIINELIAREWVTAPKYVPKYLSSPEPTSEILKYLVKSIRPTRPWYSNALFGNKLEASA